MKSKDALQKLLPSFEKYYDVKTEGALSPFVAEAEFHTHEEQYVLVRSAKISESESNEYIFFAAEEHLSCPMLTELENLAWQTGLSRVHPHYGHRNSDVTLVLLADSVDEEAFLAIKRIHRTKSYMFTFKGWSNFKVICMELNTFKLAYNRLGGDLKKVLKQIPQLQENAAAESD